ncbi:FHA domain protein [Pyrenophora tritici-repentis]|nr:FHA domain protein [Pyrenophora tritici-repentis]
MAPIFHIVLRDPKRYDTYATREFDLPLSTNFPIGRASSNVSKKELMAAPHNAYIDSPVISRQHAILSANSDSGVPEVYVSDQGSMHGTMLNGRRLSPHTPTRLSYGDELQFGTDVNRNEEFFVARTYLFESQLSRPFCPGFTVPDPDPESDQEDISEERRGSITDPFVIDSSPSGPSEDEQAEVTMIINQVLKQEDPVKTPAVVPYASSEAKADSGLDSDFDSEACSIDYPDPESDSEAEIQDSEDEEETDLPSPIFIAPMSPGGPGSSTARPIAPYRDTATQPQECLPRVDLFEFHPTPSMNTLSHTPSDDVAPPLPPRPSSRPWNESFPNFGQQDVYTGYNFDGYMGGFGERPPLFAHAPPPSDFMQSRTTMQNFCAYPGQMFQADRLPSPPRMPTSDVETTPPLQPGRRTKVSIEEIVEEQPPTPESVNSLKRKADVLEEEEEPVATSGEVSEEVAVAPEHAPADATVTVLVGDAAATQTATAIAQRPKKTPRSVLSRVLNKAAYPLLGATGAVVSFALLSTLPDNFFV